MAALGRKLLPMEAPQSPAARFAWLVRALRACSADPEIRNTETFAQRLRATAPEALKPATINKLENADLDFTVERCIAYERVLGLKDGDLVYPYIWTMRAADLRPKSSWQRLREAGGQEIELLVRLSQGDSLEPLEWLHLSHLYGNRRDIFSERLRTYYFHGLIRDFGASYEKDQMLLREAVANSGEDVIPYVLDAVRNEPMNYFNAIEALGYLDGQSVRPTLRKLLEDLSNPFLSTPILEAGFRYAMHHHDAHHDLPIITSGVEEFVIDSVADPSQLFTVRESALGALRALRLSGFSTGQRAHARLTACAEDLRQLSLQPQAFSQVELVQAVLNRFEGDLAASRSSNDVPIKIPGLAAIIQEGVFGTNRSSRLIIGALLRPWVHSPAVSDALGATMCAIPGDNYGIQRSLVRLITKIGSPNLGRNLGRLAASGVRDEGTRLSLAWGIGVSGDHSDADSLRLLFSSTQSRETKRAVITAACRRGFAAVLRDSADDPDPLVRSEASSALLRVRQRASGGSPKDS